MKVTLDTNAVINLCANGTDTIKVVEHFKAHPNDRIYILAKTADELKELTPYQNINLEKLDAAYESDSQQYFTIGVSVIGGPDGIRGNDATRDGIQKEVVDITGAYARYKTIQIKDGNPVKNIENWLKQNNHQSDAVLYERATELASDYFVSDDVRILKVVPISNACKPITLKEFVGLLSS